MMEGNSTVKQVSIIEYIGPYQIQTTSIMSVNFSTRIETYGPKTDRNTEHNISVKGNKKAGS